MASSEVDSTISEYWSDNSSEVAVSMFVCEDGQPYGDLSYETIGALMKVHRELGPGFDEVDYHVSFLDELGRQNIPARSKVRGRLVHRGVGVDGFELDVLVNDCLIVELKHVPYGLVPAHFVQLINYLTYWQCPAGLLCNFGQESLRHRRLALSTAAPEVVLQGNPEIERQFKWTVAVARSLVAHRFHTYSLTTLNRLIAVEIQHHGYTCCPLNVGPSYGDRRLPARNVNAWVVNQDFILFLGAHSAGPSRQDLAILRSYCKHSALRNAALINFTPSQITITAISH